MVLMNHTRATCSIALVWEGEAFQILIILICYQVWQPSRPAVGRDGPSQGSKEDPGAPPMGGILPWPAQAQYGAVGHILSSNALYMKT